MINKNELFNCEICLIGVMLSKSEMINKLSITSDYLKDYNRNGNVYNFKYIFQRIIDMYGESHNNELLTALMADEKINDNVIIECVQGNPYENIGSVYELENVIIQSHKETLLEKEHKKLITGETNINSYVDNVNKIQQLGTIKQQYLTSEDLKECLNAENASIRKIGFPRLEAMLKLKEHDFMVISASGTGGGKTALALNLISNLSKYYDCLYFNMEMAEDDIKKRLIAIESGVRLDVIENYKYITNRDIKAKIDMAVNEIGKRKLIIHTGAKSLTSVKSVINRLDNAKHTIIFLDHMGMVRIKGNSIYERTTELAKSLRAIALNNNVTMIALSQVSRQQNQQNGRRNQTYNEAPTLSRLKESGEIENSARQVIFIWNRSEDDYYIRIAKNTRGSVNLDIPITFMKNTMTIRER